MSPRAGALALKFSVDLERIAAYDPTLTSFRQSGHLAQVPAGRDRRRHAATRGSPPRRHVSHLINLDMYEYRGQITDSGVRLLIPALSLCLVREVSLGLACRSRRRRRYDFCRG